MDFELEREPLRVKLRSDGRPRVRTIAPFALPDSLYRMATRRVIGGLIKDNRRLRNELAAAKARPVTLKIEQDRSS